MPRVAAPVLSRDGRLAVVSVTEPSYEAAKSVADLWLIATDGSAPPRRLTQHPAPETQPAFSRDGRLLAFVAKRDGDEAAQIYVIDLVDGGEARRVTQLSTGARLPRFSPDGSRLLFESDVFPGMKNDEENRAEAKRRKELKYQVRSYDGFPVRNWDRWLDDRQVHLFVADVATGQARDLLAGSDLVKQPGFSGRIELNVPTLDPIWRPDGSGIVFVASTNNDRAAYAETHTDLFDVTITDGRIRRLTGEDGATDGDSYSKPQFNGKGDRLFALLSPATKWLYNSTRLAVFEWPAAGAPVRSTATGARSVESFAIAPDGSDAFVLVEDAGRVELERARARVTVATRVSKLARGMYSDLQIGGKANAPVAVALYQSATEPAELVRVDLRDGSLAEPTRSA